MLQSEAAVGRGVTATSTVESTPVQDPSVGTDENLAPPAEATNSTSNCAGYRSSAVRRKSKLPPAFNVTPTTLAACTTTLFGYHSGIPGSSCASTC
jgi:hypothetical protein